MKVLSLGTYTDCENKHRSLECLGHEVHVHRYDDRPHDQQDYYLDLAKQIRPDFTLYIGAVEQYHGKPTLTPDTLCRLREVAPLVHMCDDAADDPWWPLLEEYHAKGCFDLQVSIDGSHVNPIADFTDGTGMLALTPTDVRPFEPKPWADRGIRCGFVGGLGHGFRADTLRTLPGMQFFEGPTGRSYDEFARAMCDIKVMPNFPETGSGRHMHVKGRVVEAGLAGCCVLEKKGSPTDRWFTPGVDYVEYETADQISEFVDNGWDSVKHTIAQGFHNRMVREHHPRVFWGKVTERLGL